MKNLILILVFTLATAFFPWAQLTSGNPDWVSAASPERRYNHGMANILGTDKVLLFGGSDGSDYLGDTWIFDLSEETWTRVSPTSSPSARYNFSLSYVGDDKILLFGGFNDSQNGETWFFDLSDLDWTELSPSTNPSARSGHSSAYIGDDMVLLFGGSDGSSDDETWIFDLSEEDWTLHTPVDKPSARYSHSTAYIGSDRVLLFGGYDGSLDNETWVYDYSIQNWTRQTASNSPSPIRDHSLTYIGDDKVLLFGGDPGSVTDDTYIYDFSDDEWTELTPNPKPAAREDLAAAYLGDGNALVFAGSNSSSEFNDSWVFDIDVEEWSEIKADMLQPAARGLHGFSYIGDDQAVLFGGRDGSQNFNDTWIYDKSDESWSSQSPGTCPSARFSFGMCYIGDDKIVMFGGSDGSFFDETWIYDSGDQNWTQRTPNPKPSARAGLSMCYLGDDKVLLFGGHDGSFDGETWVYDLRADTWTDKSPSNPPDGREYTSLTFLGDGKVLLFGGRDGSGSYNDTWVYDINNNTWTEKNPSSSPSARVFPTSARLVGDQCVLFGGMDASANCLNDTWVYDLSENSWTERNPTTEPEGIKWHKIADFNDGYVMIHGGMNNDGDYIYDYWLYSELELPALTTASITNITTSSADGGGDVTDDGGDPVTAKGVVWSTTATPTLTTNEDGKTTDGTGTGSFTSSLTGLDPETEYYVRAYGTNGVGDGYGGEESFFTLSNPPGPQASNMQAAVNAPERLDLSWDAATFPGTGATEKKYLLLRAEQPNVPSFTSSDGLAPTVDANTTIVADDISDGAVTFNDDNNSAGLTVGQQYNYALIPYTWDGTNSETYNYLTASAPTCSGIAADYPVVLTVSIESTTNNSVVVNGNVLNVNYNNVNNRAIGVELESEVSEPDENSALKQVESGDFSADTYQLTVSGLSPETHYKARAFADNDVGYSYGSVKPFWTLSDGPTAQASSPDIRVTRPDRLDLTWTDATGETGYVALRADGTEVPTLTNSDGEAPTSASTIVSSTIAADAESYNDATVSAGNQYTYALIPFAWDGTHAETYNYLPGGAITFTAYAADVPTVTTNSIDSRTHNSVTVTGEITNTNSNNGNNRGIGVELESGADPDENSALKQVASGDFTAETYQLTVTGLSAQTYYNARAFADNDAGYGYGLNLAFWTLSNEPTAQASSPVIRVTRPDRLDLSWTDATGETGYVLLRADGTEVPTLTNSDGEAPTSASTIVSSTIAADATGYNDATVSAGNQYTYALIPFAWDGTHAETYNYLPGGAITFTAYAADVPTVTTNSIDSRTHNSVTVTGEITNTNSNNGNNRGIGVELESGADPDENSALKQVETDDYPAETYQLTVTGLSAQTYYNARAFADNDAGYGYGLNIAFWTLSDEPTAQASSPVIQITQPDRLDLSWTDATGETGYVLLRADGTEVPTLTNSDGEAPTSASTIVSSTIAADATGYNDATVSAGNQYTYALIPFAWDGTHAETYNYLPGGAITFTAYAADVPTVTTNSIDSRTHNSVTVTGEITNTNSNNGNNRGIGVELESGADPDENSALKQVETDDYPAETYQLTVTGLSAQTYYNARAFADNDAGYGYGTNLAFWTYSTEPGSHPAAFSAATVSSTELQLLFSAASTISNCYGYIILKCVNSPADVSGVVDGVAPGSLVLINSTTLEANIASTAATTHNDDGLNNVDTYHYSIIPYNWDGLNPETYNYRTSATIQVVAAKTVMPPTVTTTADPVSLTTTSAEIQGEITDNGNEACSKRGVILWEYSGSDKEVGGDGVVNEESSGSFNEGTFTETFSGLDVNAQYNARAYAMNSSDYGYGLTIDFWTEANIPDPPQVVARTQNSATIDVQTNDNPSSTEYSIEVTETGLRGTAGTFVQVDGSLGSTEVWQTDAEWGQIEVTGLDSQTEYDFTATARNGAAEATDPSDEATDYTLSDEPSSHALVFRASPGANGGIFFNFTAANQITNCDGYLLLMRECEEPTDLPNDGIGYSVGDVIGNSIVAAIITNTSQTNMELTSGITSGTTYQFKLIPFNWDGSNAETYNYRTSPTIPNAVGNSESEISARVDDVTVPDGITRRFSYDFFLEVASEDPVEVESGGTLVLSAGTSVKFLPGFKAEGGSSVTTEITGELPCSVDRDADREAITGLPIEPLSMNIYPNPNQGLFTIDLSYEPEEPVTIEISNLLGAKQTYSDLLGASFRIDISDFPQGVYFVTVRSGAAVLVGRVVYR